MQWKSGQLPTVNEPRGALGGKAARSKRSGIDLFHSALITGA